MQYQSLPSTLYPLLSTLYPLPSTLYSLLSTLYPLLSTLYSLPSKTLIKRQIELLFESGEGRVGFEEEVVLFL